MVFYPPMHVGRKLFKPLARNLAEPRFLQGTSIGGVGGGRRLGAWWETAGHRLFCRRAQLLEASNNQLTSDVAARAPD